MGTQIGIDHDTFAEIGRILCYALRCGLISSKSFVYVQKMLYHVSGGGPLPRCRYATLPTVIDATAASRTVRAYARSTPAVCQSIHPPSIFPSDSAVRPATDDRREGYDAASTIDGQLSGTCEPPERRSFVAET